MGREPPPTPLNGTALVAWLSRQALVDGPAATPSFVAGLGRWLGWADAIPLAAAVQAPTAAGPSARPRTAAVGVHAVELEAQRVRAALSRAIDDDAALAADTDFAPHRRHVAALQHEMELDIATLRTQVRAAVARQSPALARLAAIDGVLAAVVAPREQHLLGTLPALLERHFTRLRRDHADAPAAWLPAFRHDTRQLLLAELDLRLQPVQGLLDALRAPPRETP